MLYRSLMTLAAVVLLIGAVTAVDTQHVTPAPSWPVRLGMGSAGVLLALGAYLIGGPSAAPPGPATHGARVEEGEPPLAPRRAASSE
jgi:hypothetical protein